MYSTKRSAGKAFQGFALYFRVCVAPRIADVSFEARRGEILGIAGVVGSGRSELLKAIFGALPTQNGSITWLGKRLKNRLHLQNKHFQRRREKV